MSSSLIADRRALRRKLGFWRIATILVLIGAIAFAWYAVFGENLPGNGRDHVAVVSISGIISDDQELVDRLDAIAANAQAKALVVEISSPGGTTYGGEVIYKALRRVAAKKPVVIDIRTLAASAGYMIALGGDTIIAGDNSITGSIGVIFQYPQVKDLMDKIGVSLDEIKSSPMKAEPSPFHPPSEEAKAMIDRMVKDSYAWFVDLVAERRKMPRAEALALADGSIFTGRQALANKLIDKIGGHDTIVATLKERNIPDSLDYVEWPAKKSGSPFFLASLARQFVETLGLSDVGTAKLLKNIGEDKLFLDGLLSAWQIDTNQR